MAGPKVGAVITRMQRSDSLAPAVCTLVANTCPCRSETDISLTRTVSAVRVSDSAAGSGQVGLSLWASRGLARASAAARQVLPYLYIAYDVKTNNVGVNRMLIPILTYDFTYEIVSPTISYNTNVTLKYRMRFQTKPTISYTTS